MNGATCRNCGQQFDSNNIRQASFHELGDCTASADTLAQLRGEEVTINTERRAAGWVAVVRRGARPIYLTDHYQHAQTAQGDAERFVALVKGER